MSTTHDFQRSRWIRPSTDGTFEVVTVGIHVDGRGFETATSGLTLGEAEQTMAHLLAKDDAQDGAR